MKRAVSGCAALAALSAVVAMAVPAHAADGNLPGGTSISVAINSPANGAVRPGPVTVTGTAAIGAGQVSADTSLTYVVDVSGSTTKPGTGCGGDQNGDTQANTILDCEIAAAKTLNDQAATLGTVGDIGAAVFADSGATADVTPGGGDDLITQPTTDADGAGGRDIDQVLTSMFSDGGLGGVGQFTSKPVGQLTNFAAGVTAATTVATAPTNTKPHKIIVFLSDGIANLGGSVSGPLSAVPANVTIFTFAVGGRSSCTNTGENDEGSLADIAIHGGTCTPVPDVASLPSVLPGVIASQLTGLSLTVDGNPGPAITDVAPGPLPQNGPQTFTYSVTTGALAAGTHHLCVTAAGSDAGGNGNVTDCHDVVVYLKGEAFALQATGLINISKTPFVTCPPNDSKTSVLLNTPVGSVHALNANCVLDPATGTTTAAASISNVSLLAGAITISTIESSCMSGASGITGSSRVGTINGIPIGIGHGSIGIPGVAQVFYNETTTTPSGQLVQNAIRVRTLLGQQIILAGCRLG